MVQDTLPLMEDAVLRNSKEFVTFVTMTNKVVTNAIKTLGTIMMDTETVALLKFFNAMNAKTPISVTYVTKDLPLPAMAIVVKE